MAKAFAWLGYRQYEAVQRALYNIWHGVPAPFADAAQSFDVSEERLMSQVADFANLIVQALVDVPERMQEVYRREQGSITRRLFADLQQRLAALENAETQREQQAIRAQLAEVNAKIAAYYEPLQTAREQLDEMKQRVHSARSRVRQWEAQERQLAHKEQEMRSRCAVLVATVNEMARSLGEDPEGGD